MVVGPVLVGGIEEGPHIHLELDASGVLHEDAVSSGPGIIGSFLYQLDLLRPDNRRYGLYNSQLEANVEKWWRKGAYIAILRPYLQAKGVVGRIGVDARKVAGRRIIGRMFEPGKGVVERVPDRIA